ncbi:MAG: methyltransferase [Holophagaceae bacterium]|nr:methyltransferase [Holophagaceae bacterium]
MTRTPVSRSKSQPAGGPDPTAVRTALWRALHLELDLPPHIFEDRLGLQLVEPGGSWRQRPDMHPTRTARARASIVARARFVEDLVEEEARRGVDQYVLLGAGLDTCAQRRPDLADRVRFFEVDPPASQDWKRHRLEALGHGHPTRPCFIPFDFESDQTWVQAAALQGFAPDRPSVVAALGVCMYLTREAIRRTLDQVAALAQGTVLVMTFHPPLEQLEPQERGSQEATMRYAAAAGTPFLSLLAPKEVLDLARGAGFRDLAHVSSAQLATRYFQSRTDGLRPSSAEEILVARV